MQTSHFSEFIYQMSIVRLATFAMIVSLLPMSAVAIACSPPPNWSEAKEREEEDRAILEADVFYRGVIEDVDVSDPVVDHWEASFNKPIVTDVTPVSHPAITRVLW